MKLTQRQKCAEELHGAITWESSIKGHFECPGARFHTAKETPAAVMLDGVPSIVCYHQSCLEEVQDANFRLRSAIGRAEKGKHPQYDPAAEESKLCSISEQKAKAQDAGRQRLNELLNHPVPVKQWLAWSPSTIPHNPADHWKPMLNLFPQNQIVWIGGLFDSGGKEHRTNFRPVSEWLNEKACPANYICVADFPKGCYRRAVKNKDTVIGIPPFIVVESDVLSKEQTGAVFEHLAETLPLAAIVDTGGKSLHGWFIRDGSKINMADLQGTLVGLGMDPSVFRFTQPVRLPGCINPITGRWQRLIYLDVDRAAAFHRKRDEETKAALARLSEKYSGGGYV